MYPYMNFFFSEFMPLFLAQREKQMSPKPKRTCPHHRSIAESTPELLNSKMSEVATKKKYGYVSVVLSLCACRFFPNNKNVNNKKSTYLLGEMYSFSALEEAIVHCMILSVLLAKEEFQVNTAVLA